MFKRILLISASVLALSACAKGQSMPLVFGTATTVGISVSTSAAGGTPDVTFGYKRANIAIVPLTTPDNKLLTSVYDCVWSPEADADGNYDSLCSEDAMSVIGQFNVDAENTDTHLGEFFATGSAAEELARGFRENLNDVSQ